MHLDFPESQQWGQAGIEEPTIHQLAEELEQHVAGVDAVYAPAGIGNSEHELVRNGVLAVRPDATLYADLPYALLPDRGGFALPSQIGATGRQRSDLDLDAATAAEKVEASRCYESQLRQLIAVFGAFLTVEALGHEVFWDRKPV